MNVTTENNLWIQVRTNNWTARDQMILGYRGLVLSQAKKYQHSHESFEDLIGEGDIALCEAVDEYPQKKPDCSFSTFAFTRIRAAMISFARRDGTVCKRQSTGRDETVAIKQIDELTQELQEAGCEGPDYDDVKEVLGKRTSALWRNKCNCVTLCEELETQIEPIDGQVIDFNNLPEQVRILLKTLSEGITLGQIADEWAVPREELYQTLYNAKELI